MLKNTVQANTVELHFAPGAAGKWTTTGSSLLPGGEGLDVFASCCLAGGITLPK